MAGNANSGNRNGGKSLAHQVQKAMRRAIKQGDAGIRGQRALSELLADLMQADVARFMQVAAPYIPKEIIIDQTISIADALQEARNRVIDMGNAQIIQDAPASILSDQTDSLSLLDQPQPDDALTSSQGEGTGGVGAA